MRKERGRVEAVESVDGELGDLRTAGTADGGTALSTTLVYIKIPDGTRYARLKPHTYASSATVAKVALCPYLTVLKTTDSGATFTDYSANAQDASAATDVTLSSLDTLANGDWVYCGAHRKFAGIDVDVDAANGTASVILVEYWDGHDWVDIADTDGTISAGATFAQDGDITWTVPAAWAKSVLAGRNLYWLRISVSVALDSSTTQNHWIAIPESTARWEIPSGDDLRVSLFRDYQGWAFIEALTDTGTAKLIVNVATGPYEEF